MSHKKQINPVTVLILVMGVAIGAILVLQQVIEPSLIKLEQRRAEALQLDGEVIPSEHCEVSLDGERTCEPVTCYVQTGGDLYCKRGPQT